MRLLFWLLPLLTASCSAQVPALSPRPGEEVRRTLYPNGRTWEAFIVRRYLIVDTVLIQGTEPPYQLEMVIDSTEREFRVADYFELYPSGKLKVCGRYGYEYGVDYKDGLWIHLSEAGDTLLLERYTRDLPSDTLQHLKIRLHH